MALAEHHGMNGTLQAISAALILLGPDGLQATRSMTFQGDHVPPPSTRNRWQMTSVDPSNAPPSLAETRRK